MTDLPITPSLSIPAQELAWSAARSSGPGGQNVNKVSTKVDLRFDLEHDVVLHPDVKERLAQIAHRDAEGRVIVTSDRTRSQADNLEDARQKLAEMIRRALVRPKVRKATKPSKGSKRRRLEAKSQQSAKKASRGKVDW